MAILLFKWTHEHRVGTVTLLPSSLFSLVKPYHHQISQISKLLCRRPVTYFPPLYSKGALSSNEPLVSDIYNQDEREITDDRLSQEADSDWK